MCVNVLARVCVFAVSSTAACAKGAPQVLLSRFVVSFFSPDHKAHIIRRYR
jgi:hypothetical protein